MGHGHHTAAGYRPGEYHRAGAGSEHRSASRRSKVNAAMSWPIPHRRRVESPNNSRSTPKWPAKPRRGFVAEVIRSDSVHHSGRIGLTRSASRCCVFRPGGQVGQHRRPTEGNRDEHGGDQGARHTDSVTASMPAAQLRRGLLWITRALWTAVDGRTTWAAVGPGQAVHWASDSHAGRLRAPALRPTGASASGGLRRGLDRAESGRWPGARAAVQPGPP
jgi:hypothetical protein